MKSVNYTIAIIQLFVALGAIPAGLLYLVDTSGNLMGTTGEMLADSPFNSYLVPGLFLFLINGIANLIGGILAFKRKPVVAILTLVLGITLSIWIVMQIIWIGFSSFMQPMFFAIGIIEIILAVILFKNRKRTIFK